MKTIKKFLSVLFCGISLFCASSCCLFYDMTEENGISIGYSKAERNGFISRVEWQTDKPREIVLPSEYNGLTIRELGGYIGRGYPCPFYVSVNIREIYTDADDYSSTDEKYLYEENLSWWDEVEITDYDFCITLPDELESLTFIDSSVQVAKYVREDGTVSAKVVRPTCYFYISESNKTFYTENGCLYYKKNKERAECFIYRSA
jgi:hypothetical protein